MNEEVRECILSLVKSCPEGIPTRLLVRKVTYQLNISPAVANEHLIGLVDNGSLIRDDLRVLRIGYPVIYIQTRTGNPRRSTIHQTIYPDGETVNTPH